MVNRPNSNQYFAVVAAWHANCIYKVVVAGVRSRAGCQTRHVFRRLGSVMSFEPSTPAVEPEQAADAVQTGDTDKDFQRLHERLALNSQLHLSWQQMPRGAHRSVRARAIDLSKFGVLVEAESPIPSGTIVCVQSSN